MMQAEVAWENILSLVEADEKGLKREGVKLRTYKSVRGMEGILKLSLGKVRRLFSHLTRLIGECKRVCLLIV